MTLIQRSERVAEREAFALGIVGIERFDPQVEVAIGRPRLVIV